MTEAVVFDVQRFSVHDGPGIRTTVYFKGCPLRCAWCWNPEAMRPGLEIAFYSERCRDAGECAEACPRGAVTKAPGRVDRSTCDACARCEPACPFGALRVVGRVVAVESLAAEVIRDEPFFRATGGGVTLSGGEPTFQMEAMGLIARTCAERGVSVALQTSGMFRWEAFEPHLPHISLVQYDLKLIDEAQHREMTGGSNEVILENARRFLGAGKRVQFRTPMIPRVTDSEENLDLVCTFLAELGVRSIHLLRYHRTGLTKLPRLGSPIPAFDGGGREEAEASLRRGEERLRAWGMEVST